MKRTFCLVIAVLVLLATLSFSSVAAVDAVERLEKLAATDLFPEVRAAAAIGLATLWVEDDISLEALQQIAQTGASPELQQAAAQALAARTVTGELDLDALQALAASSPFAAVRQRASALLAERLLTAGLTLEALQALATTGETLELRQAAVPALAQALLTSTQNSASLLELANGGQTESARQAAAQALLARLEADLADFDSAQLTGLLTGSSVEFKRVVAQESEPLRQAAADALAGYFHDPATSTDQVEAAASDPQNSPQLREVAAQVLRQRLLNDKRSLEALEQLANEGATAQLQGATVDALEQALVTAVGRGQLTVQQLVDGISDADSDALNQARANAAFTLLRPNLIFLTDQPLLEAVIRGESVEIGGVSISGQNPFLSNAATSFLAGLFLQFGAVNRFDDPLNDLLAMASDESLAPGFRVAAGRALVKFLSAQREKALQVVEAIEQQLDRIVIQGRRGQADQALALLEEVRQTLDSNTILINTTAEANGELGTAQRIITIKDQLAEFPDAIRTRNTQDLRDINTSVSGEFSQIKVSLAEAPDTSDEELQRLTVEGATPEVRQAASTVLSQRWAAAFAAAQLTQEALLDLARNGATVELQSATVAALTQALLQSDLTDEDLLNLVVEGETAALQQAASNAWVSRQEADVPRLTDLANGSGVTFGQLTLQVQSQELIVAVGELLQGRWAQENVSTGFLLDQVQNGATPEIPQAAAALLAERFVAEGKTEEELICLSVEAENALVRQAASQALSQVLIAQQLGEGALFNLVSQYTLAADNPLSSPELVQALIVALADRFLHPLVTAPEDPGDRLQIENG